MSESLENAMAIMTKQRCRHLPVIEDNKIIGVISMGDLVKQQIKDLNATIRYLNDYISG